MARRKKSPPIMGTGNEPETHLIQKSMPLMALMRSEYTLAEFKLLDAYLARIDSHNPEKRTVHFEKGEIERYLGVKKINAPDLKKRIHNLGQMVPVDDPTKTSSFRMVALFSEAVCEQDEKGVWQVDLTCTLEARKYIFNVENLGYLRYKLRSVVALRSRYSYILFLYLEKNRHLHLSWEVDVDELRGILRAEEEYYREFKAFNQKILKHCQQELTEKTECHYTYEPIKKGRSVKAVQFTLAPLTPGMAPVGEESSTGAADRQQLVFAEDQAGKYSSERLAFLADACDFEFSDEEMRVLVDMLLKIVPYDTEDSLGQFHYLRQKYNMLNLYASKHKITDRYNYLRSAIEREIPT